MHARSGLLVACLAALILAGDAFTPANVSFALHRRNAIGWGLSGTPIDGSCGTHLKECYGECVPLDWKTCGTLCMPPRWDCCNNGWCCRTKCVGGDSCDGTDQCAGQVPGCCFEALTDIGNCGSNKFTCPQPENGWGYCDRGEQYFTLLGLI